MTVVKYALLKEVTLDKALMGLRESASIQIEKCIQIPDYRLMFSGGLDSLVFQGEVLLNPSFERNVRRGNSSYQYFSRSLKVTKVRVSFQRILELVTSVIVGADEKTLLLYMCIHPSLVGYIYSLLL